MSRATCGCPIIDKLIVNGKPINLANNTAGREYCLDCPYDFCIQKDAKSEFKIGKEKYTIKELTAKCLNCYEMQTIFFVDDILQETRHFKQIDNNIFHLHEYDMSLKPCTLYK